MTNPYIIDISTIILLLCLGNLITVATLTAYKSGTIPRRPYWQFLAGKLLQALAWLLLALRGKIPDFYSVYAGNSILFAGFALEALALVTIDSLNQRWEIIYALTTGVCILTFWGFATTPNLYVVIASLATAVIFVMASFSLLRATNSSRLRRALGVLYGLFCLLILFRAASAFSNQDFALMSGNMIQSVSFLALYLLMLLGSNGFLLLLREHTDSQLAQANRELNLMSRIDSLTNLANRRAFDEFLSRSVRECRRRGEPLSLIMMDIDFFKNYNDLYGHSSGDECLYAVGRLLDKFCRRGSDLAARYGGEEFALILPDTDGTGSCNLAEVIRQEMCNLAIPHPSSDVADRVTLSLGVFSATPTSDSHSESWFITEADRRLYNAKHAGRNRSICI